MICDLNLTNKSDMKRCYYYYSPHLTDALTKAQIGQWVVCGVKLVFLSFFFFLDF